MPVVSASVDAFLVLAVAIIVPAIHFFRRQTQPLALHHALSLVVLLHSLFILYLIIVRWPPNIFQRLKIPLTTPSETIRAVLLQRAGLPPNASLPRPLETLLTRLASFDARTLYVRYLTSFLWRFMRVNCRVTGSGKRPFRTANTAAPSTSTPSLPHP